MQPAALMIMRDDSRRADVFPPATIARIAGRTRLLHPVLTAEELAARPELLAEAEVLFTSWGAPVLDAKTLAAAPRLRAVFHCAGTVRTFMTEAAWERALVICSAAAENALPVADYTLGAMLFSLKQGWFYALGAQRERRMPARVRAAGTYGSRVGLVSFGAIARRVRELLEPFAIEVAVYDPFLDPEQAQRHRVASVCLPELFATCDVVSVHTPLLPETRGLIGAALLRAMKPRATLINTARGAIVNEAELITVWRERPDLTAVLDVTMEEPLPSTSPLLTLPNVVLTPHIAGSVDAECARLSAAMIEEFDRWRAGQALRHQVLPAHRHLLA